MVGAGPPEAPGARSNTGEMPAVGPRYDDDARTARRCSTRTSGSASMAHPILRIGVMELRRRPGHPARRPRLDRRSPASRITGRPGARRRRARGRRHPRVDRRRGHGHRHGARCRGRRSAGAASTTVGGRRHGRAPRGVRGPADRRRDLPDRGRRGRPRAGGPRRGAPQPAARRRCAGPTAPARRPRRFPVGRRRARSPTDEPAARSPLGRPRRAAASTPTEPPAPVRRFREPAATISRLRCRALAQRHPRSRR